MQNFKFIIIGDLGTGKSSIIQRLINNTFDIGIHPTLGAEIYQKTICIDDDSVILSIWDTAGQEKFRTVTKSTFRDAVGAILVYDINNANSFRSLDQWLHDIRSLCLNDAEVIIVGNKTDLNQRQVSSDEGYSYALRQGTEFIETSALIGSNIEDTFTRLATKVYHSVKNGKIVLQAAPIDMILTHTQNDLKTIPGTDPEPGAMCCR